MPPALMLATPVVPSSWLMRVSLTNDESSSVEYPSMSTAATVMGIMLGFIFIM